MQHTTTITSTSHQPIFTPNFHSPAKHASRSSNYVPRMSGFTTPSTSQDSPTVQPLTMPEDLNINSSLEDLQTDEQRRILDTVAQVRKCGLESILSLPQLV